MYCPQQIQSKYLVPNTYSQINHPLPQTQQPDHFFQNDQQHQLLQMQYIPQKSSCYQLQNHLIDAEQQIQQEIQNLQNLKMKLRLRQQQIVQNFNTKVLPVQNVRTTQDLNINQQNNNFLNNIQTKLPNQQVFQQSLNIQNNISQYQNAIPNSVNDITAQQILKKTQQQYQQMLMNEQLLQQQQLQKYQLIQEQQAKQEAEKIRRKENSTSNHLNSSQTIKQEQLNRKRSIIDVSSNCNSPLDQFSFESFSYETAQTQMNKKVCSEENKQSHSTNTFRQRSGSSTVNLNQNNHIEYNNSLQFKSNKKYLENKCEEILTPSFTQMQSFSQNSLTQNNSDVSSIQYRNSLSNCGMTNNYSLDQSIQSNTAPINNVIKLHKDYSFQIPDFKEKHEEQYQQHEYISSGNNDQSDKKTKKKEIQNDSNYTKNLLKGFKRFMSKKYYDNKEEFEKFQSYFYNNTLSNEFVIVLLEKSQYEADFQEFLQEDPSWWMKEAKIKDIQRQLNFFEIVKNKDFTQIRTKKRSKSSPEKNQNSNLSEISNVQEISNIQEASNNNNLLEVSSN